MAREQSRATNRTRSAGVVGSVLIVLTIGPARRVWSDQFYGALFAQNTRYARKARRWLGDDAFSALFRLLVRCTKPVRTHAGTRALLRKRSIAQAHALARTLRSGVGGRGRRSRSVPAARRADRGFAPATARRERSRVRLGPTRALSAAPNGVAPSPSRVAACVAPGGAVCAVAGVQLHCAALHCRYGRARTC